MEDPLPDLNSSRGCPPAGSPAKKILGFLLFFARRLALPDRLAKNLLDFLLSFARRLLPAKPPGEESS